MRFRNSSSRALRSETLEPADFRGSDGFDAERAAAEPTMMARRSRGPRVAGLGEVAGEAARERVAGARGIDHVLERVGGGEEDVDSPSKRSAPYSPRLMMSALGPRLRMSLAALMMLCWPESWRASSSLMTSRSMRLSISRERFGLALIQKFIVSAMTSFGRSTCSSTSTCSAGWMLPSST